MRFLYTFVPMHNAKIVYLADDDEDDRYFIKEAIYQLNKNITIVEAEDGEDLLAKIQEVTAHTNILVVLDLNMPKRNGFEVLQALRSNPATKSTPSVMLSTAVSDELVRSAYEYGVNAYIKKPVAIGDYSKIAEAIARCFLETPY